MQRELQTVWTLIRLLLWQSDLVFTVCPDLSVQKLYGKKHYGKKQAVINSRLNGRETARFTEYNVRSFELIYAV